MARLARRTAERNELFQITSTLEKLCKPQVRITRSQPGCMDQLTVINNCVFAEDSMELQDQLNRQRVKHIISSYQLAGQESAQFDPYVDDLLNTYPSPLIELAIAETIVDNWATVPLVRGVKFLKQAHSRLQHWENQPIVSTLTPEQFQQITGLDPTPVFGSAELPPPRSIVQPS